MIASWISASLGSPRQVTTLHGGGLEALPSFPRPPLIRLQSRRKKYDTGCSSITACLASVYQRGPGHPSPYNGWSQIEAVQAENAMVSLGEPTIATREPLSGWES